MGYYSFPPNLLKTCTCSKNGHVSIGVLDKVFNTLYVLIDWLIAWCFQHYFI